MHSRRTLCLLAQHVRSRPTCCHSRLRIDYLLRIVWHPFIIKVFLWSDAAFLSKLSSLGGRRPLRSICLDLFPLRPPFTARPLPPSRDRHSLERRGERRQVNFPPSAFANFSSFSLSLSSHSVSHSQSTAQPQTPFSLSPSRLSQVTSGPE